eukprot:jgi/Ulvmu1/10059/UM006_0006.1
MHGHMGKGWTSTQGNCKADRSMCDRETLLSARTMNACQHTHVACCAPAIVLEQPQCNKLIAALRRWYRQERSDNLDTRQAAGAFAICLHQDAALFTQILLGLANHALDG